MANFCRYCGAQLKAEQKFCRQCGKAIVHKEDKKTEIEKQAAKVTTLIESVQRKDAEVFAELYEQTKKYVYYIILRSGVSGDAVEDVMQETYMTVYHEAGGLKNTQAALAWMKQIAFHKAVDYQRKNGRYQFTEEIEQYDAAMENQPDTFPMPEDIMENKETQRLMQKIIDALPEEQRQIIIAYYYNESTVNDIAEAMGMPVGTVKTKLYRGRNQIKDAVEQLEQKHGIRLHTVALAPVLFFLFTTEAKAANVPAAIATGLHTALAAGGQAVAAQASVQTTAQAGAQIVTQAGAQTTAQTVTQAGAQTMTQAVVQTTAQAGAQTMAQAGVQAAATAVKTAGMSLMMKITVVTIAVAVVGGGGYGIYHHFNASSPEKTLEAFEDAYNTMDIDALMKCMDEETQAQYEVIGQYTSVLGMTPGEILKGVFDLGYDLGLDMDQYPKLDIKVQSVDVAGDYATATCVIELDGETEFDSIDMVKEGHIWYIDTGSFGW